MTIPPRTTPYSITYFKKKNAYFCLQPNDSSQVYPSTFINVTICTAGSLHTCFPYLGRQVEASLLTQEAQPEFKGTGFCTLAPRPSKAVLLDPFLPGCVARLLREHIPAPASFIRITDHITVVGLPPPLFSQDL